MCVFLRLRVIEWSELVLYIKKLQTRELDKHYFLQSPSLCSVVSLVTDEDRTECCDGVTRSGARLTHPPAQAADADC